MKDAQSMGKIRFLVTFLHFEYNFRIFANFGIKSKKIYRFRLYVFKKLVFFLDFFYKDYTFYSKNLVFTTKDAQSMLKISFLVTFSHF